MKRIVFCICVLFVISGCASSKYDGYGANYSKYVDSATKAVNPNGGKLVEMIAVEGQNIELKGVKTFIVYAPTGQGDSGIKPPEQERPSEWVSTINSLIGAASSFGTTAVMGSVVKGIVKATAENAGHNTSSVSTATNSNANQSNTDSHDSSSTVSTNSTSAASTDSHNTSTSTDSHDTTSTAATTTTTNTPTTTTTTTGAAGTTTGGTVTQ